MKKLIGAALVAIGLVGIAPAADATVYDFTFTGDTNYTVTGEFTTNATDTIIAASGTVTSLDSTDPSGTFVLAPGSPGAGGTQDWSNTYSASLPGFDGNGLGILIAGTTFASLYNGVAADFGSCASTCFSVDTTPGGLFNPGDEGSLSITAVPEPSAWVLMLLGFAGIGFAVRKSRKEFHLAAAS